MKWICLILGGLSGTLARYSISGITYKALGTNFPHGTFIVNMVGCFLLGFLAALSESKFMLSPNTKLLLMVGFCGAFTTFSTFMLETTYLMKHGENLQAFLNIFLSVVIGFLVLRLGLLIGEII